ncbi:unnamed protein product [Symbiodinium natans]|uniref:Uncharacterized protein n=1 Tax=Symbiodinium natans TaxID=878477 RepID=A0A812M2F7_9DINO|nr:unnamed protein product [Symbiodinium natans]
MRRRDLEGRAGRPDARRLRRAEDQATAEGDNSSELLLCTRHQKKRPWSKLEADAQKKWVCIASCPCTIQVGGGEAALAELRLVLRSRNEEQLLKCLEAGAAPAAGGSVAPPATPAPSVEVSQTAASAEQEEQKRKEREMDEERQRERERQEREQREKEKERALRAQKEKEKEKEKEREREKEKEKAAQAKAAAPVKDPKDTKPMSKVRQRMQEANIDFADL